MGSNACILPSFAKINLHLQVIGKRADGYHDICTVFQTVSLHDTINIEPHSKLIFKCDDPAVPLGDRNIVVRAAEKLRERYRIRSGARIQIEKRIPSPGGLGGGSSNAAAALMALAKLWELELSAEVLHDIAAELGADVPYFLYGGTALGTGRGTDITPLADVAENFILIVAPDVHISTADAFERLYTPSLTNAESKHILQICRFNAKSFDLRSSAIRNDFEASIFRSHPEVGRVKEKLVELGAHQAMMSGSGASVFGFFDKEETRQAAIKALDEYINWRKFAVATISRDKYREALKQVY